MKLALVFLTYLISIEAYAQQQATVKFESASAILTDKSQEDLGQFAKRIGDSSACLVIEGYFDGNEKNLYLDVLAKARSLELYQQLVKRGINPHSLSFSSLGGLIMNQEYESQHQQSSARILVKEHQCEERPRAPAQVTHDFPLTFVFYFDHKETRPQPFESEQWRRFIGAKAIDGSFRLAIKGHSDRQGGETYNILLSKLRALEAYKRLVDSGVPPDLITMDFFGSSQPVDEQLSVRAFRLNRRVELTWEQVNAPLTSQTDELDRTTVPAEEIQLHVAEGRLRHQIGLYVGRRNPPSSLVDDVDSATTFGLAIRYHAPEISDWPDYYEIMLGRYEHESKSPGIQGKLLVNYLQLGLSHKTQWSFLAPKFHMGMSLAIWSGETQRVSTNQQNDANGNAVGMYAGIGQDFYLLPRLYIEPKFEITYLFSDLEGLNTAFLVELGWEI